LKYIDITTAHNISIRYELANTALRALAWGIDFFFLMVYTIVISVVATRNMILFYLLLFFVVAFYHLVFELFNNGQSPGKRILKIKVVTLHGRTAKPQDYFLRWIFRMLEITGCLGVIAALFVSSTEKNQRIGDMLAQTTVIKLRSDQLYNLRELEKMGEHDRKITYPKIVMYNDNDMMLVKDALKRYKKDANIANKAFVTELADRIAADLDVQKDEGGRIQFLETALYDYINLTR